MELDGEHAAVPVSLHDAVRGDRSHGKGRREHFDRLVMEGIDGERVQPVDLIQECVPVAEDRMGRFAVRGILPVGDGAGMLQWKVLIQGAAGGDVQELGAAADAEDGLPAPEGDAGIEQVAGIPPGIDRDAGIGQDSLAVAGRIDILPAREEQTVQTGDERFHSGGIRQHRQDDGLPARLPDRIDVGIRDDMGPAPADSRRHTDERCLPPGRKGQAQEGQQDGKAQLSLHFRMQ